MQRSYHRSHNLGSGSHFRKRIRITGNGEFHHPDEREIDSSFFITSDLFIRDDVYIFFHRDILGYLCGGFSHRDALSLFGQPRSFLYPALFLRCNGRLDLRRQLFAHLRHYDPFFASHWYRLDGSCTYPIAVGEFGRWFRSCIVYSHCPVNIIDYARGNLEEHKLLKVCPDYLRLIFITASDLGAIVNVGPHRNLAFSSGFHYDRTRS